MRPYFEASDIAINPMLSGSGTNLKQLEYMAMGIPVVSTPVGARGIGFKTEVEGFIEDIVSFPAKVKLLISNPSLRARVGTNARIFVKNFFDWAAIVPR